MQWTSEQLKAIENRQTNMLVSAAAGSGKTALLIQRIIRIILEEKVEVDRLLILTFTRGAAGEMKNRLSKALAQELENSENDRSFIMKQMNSLGSAAISTLHSFCLSILRQYFHKVDIDPGFTMGNDVEMALMLKETLDEVFEEEYQASARSLHDARENPDETLQLHDFSDLVEKYSGNKHDEALKESVENLYRFLATQPNFEVWCQEAVTRFDCDEKSFEESVWGSGLKKILQTELQGVLDYANKACSASNTPGFEKTHEQMKMELKSVEGLKRILNENLELGLQQLQEINYERYKGNPKQDREWNDVIKSYRDEGKKSLVNLQNRFAGSYPEMIRELRELKEPMADLVTLTKKFWTAFQKKKAKKNLLDYNDLEQLTLKVLMDPQVGDELRRKFRYVFLDEYQDTNEMQETILQCIVRENNYFMVGDVKQSIYRFRLADPTIFINKYEDFGQNNDPRNSLVTLNKNFRSAQGVIDGVNAIFTRIMTPGLGEIKYDEQAMLNKGLPHSGPYEKTEIHIIEESKLSDAENTEGYAEAVTEDLSAVEIEARFVADKIQSMVGTSFFDTRQNRERLMTYGDFGVLMRSVAGRGDIYLKIFNEMGIPTYFDGGTNYYESLEITMIINLLNLMDNQHQDLPLLSVMTSPIGGFTTTECTRVRIQYPQGFFYEAAETYCNTETDELSQKLAKFYNQLEHWRNESKLMPVEEFLWKIYLESGYYLFVGALPGGEQRQCNLRILLKRAGDYKKSTLRGLYQFIRFVENMKKYKQDISPPVMVSNHESVVRVMTIHKSKGLEFPIVFLTGTGKGFNKRSTYNQILFHKELGICPDYVNLEQRYKRNSLAKEVCKAQSNIEMLSEEMRLLYVGMTRAEERLFIVGTVKNKIKALQRWKDEPDEYRLANASSLLDWAMMGALGGNIRENDESTLETNNFLIAFHNNAVSKAAEADQVEAIAWSQGNAVYSGDKEEAEQNTINEASQTAIFDRLNYRYPFKTDQDLPSKMSVTEIKGLQQKQESEAIGEKNEDVFKVLKTPKFIEKKQADFSPTQKGSALHLLMEVANLEPMRKKIRGNGVDDFVKFLEKYLNEEREKLINCEFLPEALARTINLNKLVRFYSSSLGIRMLSSPQIKREVPFNYACDPGQINSDWEGINQKVMVQGIIDCVFLEDDKWVVLDYKTDFYQTWRQKSEIIKNYEKQVNLYAQAITELTGIGVKEKIISFISMEENIAIGR
jgi:ATP-dependent helicase/nuclease subunit A